MGHACYDPQIDPPRCAEDEIDRLLREGNHARLESLMGYAAEELIEAVVQRAMHDDQHARQLLYDTSIVAFAAERREHHAY